MSSSTPASVYVSGRRPRLPQRRFLWAADVLVCPSVGFCGRQTSSSAPSKGIPIMVVRKRLKITGPALAFVTMTVTDWRPIFKDEAAAKAVLEQLQETAQHCKVSIVGYVLMPSHFHRLLGFPEIEHLSQIMQTFKSLSSRRLKTLDLDPAGKQLYVDGKFRLWKQRFDDLIIVSEGQFRVKLAYIHNNPVKAGLVNDAKDWPYSSAGDWSDSGGGILKIDKTFGWVKPS